MVNDKEKELFRWNKFQQRHKISDAVVGQFKQYWECILETNKKTNLTRIISLEDAIWDHFEDSLALCSARECESIDWLADVGTGAGFPGIPLKLLYPQMSLTLIEVNEKKIAFLDQVIEKLELTHCEVIPLDWRTFLRTTAFPITLFCARASLRPEELIRMFQPASAYRQAECVYWASQRWHEDPTIETFIHKKTPYQLRNKRRTLVFLSADKSQ